MSIKRIRILGLCFLAVLAVSALSAASASARSYTQAKYENCEKAVTFNGHKTGLFTGKNCWTVSPTHEGGYQWSTWKAGEGEKVTLKGKSGKSVIYVSAWGTIECAKSKATGEIGVAISEAEENNVRGPYPANEGGWIKVTFEKCKGKPEPGGTAVACRSVAGKGKIATETLITRVGSEPYTNPPWEGSADVTIGGSYTFGSKVATFECGSAAFKMMGGLGDPEVVEPFLNGPCSNPMTLSFKAFIPSPGAPFGYVTFGAPFMEVNGTVFGASLQTTLTLKLSRTICIGNLERTV